MRKSPRWQNRVQEIFQVCQDELKRTTQIGKKMLSASKTSTDLHDAYEELGALVLKEMREGRLEWDHPRAQELLSQIDTCEKDLEFIEEEVNKIRFAAGGPVDISSHTEGDVGEAEDLEKNSKPKGH